MTLLRKEDVMLTKEFHVAPMMGITYREFRYFCRLLTKEAVLWTEMVVDDTILYTDDLDHHLGYDEKVEPPLVCQIGGNQPAHVAAVTQRVLDTYGYSEINLNAGCPSHRVASKRAFGAALLQKVDIAVAMLAEMQRTATSIAQQQQPQPEATTYPRRHDVSIKLRIGVDDQDDLAWTTALVDQIAPVCARIYVHARKVHTQGLDPAANRRVPPLDYPRVYALCRRFPQVDFWINGGIASLEQACTICYGSTTTTATASGDESQAIPPSEMDADTVNDADGYTPSGHGVLPCATCRQPFGSCVTAPTRVPPNLRGCMVGRALVDDPMQFAVLDTVFFGRTANPSQSRRHVLTQYTDYLIDLYPRRCGDYDTAVTSRPPGHSPTTCYVCAHCQQGHGEASAENESAAGTRVRLKSHVIGRALKPVHGAFSGQPGLSKAWRRLLQTALRDEIRRNCGPAFLLQRVLHALEEAHEGATAVLDQAFVAVDEHSANEEFLK